MLLLDRKYYKPSKEARVLALLDSLAQESDVSQSTLGRRLRLSSAMVNQYLKELQDINLIQYEAVNGKSYRYLLTSEGERTRRELFSGYSSETIRIYTALKDLILAKLKSLQYNGLTKLTLFGASETCEVVLSALIETEFEIVALVDNDVAKHGQKFHGYVISPPEVLQTLSCQAVLITSFAWHEEIYQQLEPISRKRNMEIIKL